MQSCLFRRHLFRLLRLKLRLRQLHQPRRRLLQMHRWLRALNHHCFRKIKLLQSEEFVLHFPLRRQARPSYIRWRHHRFHHLIQLRNFDFPIPIHRKSLRHRLSQHRSNLN